MPENLKALVVGATGQTGKAIAKELAKSDSFSSVTLFSRRPIADPAQGDKENVYSKFDVKVVDFDKLQANHSMDFTGYDVGFSAIGLIGTSSSNEDKRRVDRDYAVAAAKLAKAGGCNSYHVVTGGNGNRESSFFFNSNKAWTEYEITEIGFERVAFYRPGQLVGGESSGLPMAYKLTNPIVKSLDCSRIMSLEIPELALVIVHQSLQPPNSPVDIYENHGIHKLGVKIKKEKSNM